MSVLGYVGLPLNRDEAAKVMEFLASFSKNKDLYLLKEALENDKLAWTVKLQCFGADE